jgi:hypothetical protein
MDRFYQYSLQIGLSQSAKGAFGQSTATQPPARRAADKDPLRTITLLAIFCLRPFVFVFHRALRCSRFVVVRILITALFQYGKYLVGRMQTVRDSDSLRAS